MEPLCMGRASLAVNFEQNESLSSFGWEVPVPGFSFSLRSVIRRHAESSAWLGMAEPWRRIWLGCGGSWLGLCLCILSAVHAVFRWQAHPQPPHGGHLPLWLPPVISLLGLGGTEGKEI